jgi:hypothetical protein
MRKASTRLPEQGTQTPSPAPDLIPAEPKNQPRTHIAIGTANGGTSKPQTSSCSTAGTKERHLPHQCSTFRTGYAMVKVRAVVPNSAPVKPFAAAPRMCNPSGSWIDQCYGAVAALVQCRAIGLLKIATRSRKHTEEFFSEQISWTRAYALCGSSLGRILSE